MDPLLTAAEHALNDKPIDMQENKAISRIPNPISSQFDIPHPAHALAF